MKTKRQIVKQASFFLPPEELPEQGHDKQENPLFAPSRTDEQSSNNSPHPVPCRAKHSQELSSSSRSYLGLKGNPPCLLVLSHAQVGSTRLSLLWHGIILGICCIYVIMVLNSLRLTSFPFECLYLLKSYHLLHDV